MKLIGLTAALLGALTAVPAVLAQEVPPAAETALDYQNARTIGTQSRLRQWYDPAIFDLSDLPEFEPRFDTATEGTIRQWGNNYIEDSGLVEVWQEEFRQFYPNVEFENNLTSSANAFPGLITGLADIGQMGREALYHELNGFVRDDGVGYPVGVTIANGSYDTRGWTFALGVYVHKDNPIAGLTIEQLDGIFGAARTGGWVGTQWDSSAARGADENIRTWGQLGLTGEWADKPISVYGYNFSYNFPDEFEKKVFGGGQRWNEDLVEYANTTGLNADGSITNGGELMLNDLANDPYGIAYAGQPFLNDGTRAVPLATSDDSEFVPITHQTIHDRSYPLTRNIMAYVSPERIEDPMVSEFMRFIVSQQGQIAVAEDAKYIPLDATTSQQQLDIIDAGGSEPAADAQ